MAAKNQSFRKLLQRSLLLEHDEIKLFEQIPDAILDGIFQHNFNGNLATAERVLFNRYSDVEDVDTARLEGEKKRIANLAKSSQWITHAFLNQDPVLFVTDNDNDGSLAQAILIEFLKALPQHARELVHIEYAQPIGQSRGLTYEIVEKATEARGWSNDTPFTLVTADNGINNSAEVDRIRARWSAARIIISDHHMPSKDVVREDAQTTIFNPKYKPTDYFQRKNISGANTLGVLLTQTLRNYLDALAQAPTKLSPDQELAVANMAEIGSWANLLDYANADIADMPTRPYIIDKALKLRPLLNVSNSMNTLVTGSFDAATIEAVAQVSNGLTVAWINEQIEQVQLLNVFAHKLLNMYHRLHQATGGYSGAEFNSELAQELSRVDNTYTSINPNYIEQLRPIIFNLAAIDDKDRFMGEMAEAMTDVFNTLRKNERTILDGLRTVGLLRQDRRQSSTILYPIHDQVTKVFNRKLLGKAYNQDNNGFLLILSRIDEQEASGSMRSLYPITEILEGKEAIEAKLGVEVDFQGHEMAAGFFVRAKPGQKVTEQVLSQLNAWIDDRISVLKANERVNLLPTVEVDFASVGLVKKINNAVKANLAGMWGVPAIIRFSNKKADAVWVTDPKTTEQVNLTEVVKHKQFGYQAIATDFHGGAFVVPVELLRTIVDSKYKKVLRLSYMDEGVFIGNQVVDPDFLPKLVPMKGGRDDQEALAQYYQETYKDSHFLNLTRDDFRNLPYFRFNKYGQSEFELVENLLIDLLDRANQDVLAVIDTEGTGLGKAPKCFNIGGTNIKVAEGSGTTIDDGYFEAGYFRNERSQEFLLTPDQLASLIPIDEDEDNTDFDPKTTTVLYKVSLDNVLLFDRFLYPGTADELERVRNVKDNGNGTVIYNRTIDGSAFSYLINNNDFAITSEFENLTGISNGMVEKLGRPSAQVDKELVEYYTALTNGDGDEARIVFQAHNMPYDKGVISANLQAFNDLLNAHVTSDTAKLARKAKLAYDDTPVCSFVDVDGIGPKVYFYDSPYSNYSMSTFLDRVKRGKGGVFPDITAKLLLRYDAERERFSVIDRVENGEVLLDVSVDDLLQKVGDGGKRMTGNLPNNAVKYSVERLSSRAMIRNILLLEDIELQLVPLPAELAAFRQPLELFQRQYHFDDTPKANIENFTAALLKNEQHRELLETVDLESFALAFLANNKAIQAKFHDSWIYEKVLHHYEPDAKTLRVPADVVEQINYLTDLPSSKIRKVCEDIIRFKRHFGVESALVHEQHNNIRQRSEDGQGLSDTAYECILPQFLGLMKYFNPFDQSVRLASEAMIESNMKGSLIQTMVGDDFNNELARDSFSMRQMLSFSRLNKTDLVKRAKALAQGKDVAKQAAVGSLDDVKFKLSADVLPVGTAIYATPKRHLTQEEIADFSKKLDFILVNEQTKEAAVNGKFGGAYVESMIAITQANDEQSKAYRDELLTVFDKVIFSKRDAEVKKIADLMRAVAEDGHTGKPETPYALPRGFLLSDSMLETARGMGDGMEEIYTKLGQEDAFTPIRDFVTHLGLYADAQREAQRAKEATAAAKGKSAKDENFNEMESEALYGLKPVAERVRQDNFLPELNVVRREPMKFFLKHQGVSKCLAYVKEIEALRQASMGQDYGYNRPLGQPVTAEVEGTAAAPAPARRKRKM